jgi:hypothetical protein
VFDFTLVDASSQAFTGDDLATLEYDPYATLEYDLYATLEYDPYATLEYDPYATLEYDPAIAPRVRELEYTKPKDLLLADLPQQIPQAGVFTPF